METTISSLKEKYEAAKVENPKARIRDIARLLGSSEAQLLATGIGETVTLLEGDFREFLKEVSNEAIETVLQKASDTKAPIMIFVGNRGCIQIHTGEVNKLVRTGPWFNVLDPDLNVHLRTEAIAKTYVVKKPSEAGIVTALEVFDKNGELIIQLFGKRKPGIPELESWREVVKTVADF
jgi:putative heme degradation protein